MKEREIEPGTPEINKKYSIVVDKKGPYLVYGHPLLKQQFIVQNEEGHSWSYRDGGEYDTRNEPTALCRCLGLLPTNRIATGRTCTRVGIPR